MALTDEGTNGFYMPVAPAYGGGNNGGFGGWGGDWAWIILLLLAFGGGWGNGGFGGGMMWPMMMGGAAGGWDLYPWLNNSEHISDGFRDAQLHDSVTSVRDGVNSLANQLCSCCGDIQMSLANGFAGVEQGANTRQMANMNQAFAAQTAMAQGFNQLGTQLADSCCENRLASADLKYTIATENCADRAALSDGIRDVIANQTAGIQRILDQLCNDKIDAKNEKIADLERQLTMANLAASQTAQNAFIAQGLNQEVDALYNRLSNCPVPTIPVYGRQPIFTCGSNCGCGCGNGSM